MKIIADTHTHSLACDHAYSTITENVTVASQKGLKFLCTTEHSSGVPGAPSKLHFRNLSTLPRYIQGVMVVRGAEVNILDEEGTMEFDEDLLGRLEWIIGSMHVTNYKPATKAEHTKAWMNVAQNPQVHIIGHCGDSRFEFDHKPVLQEFAKTHKVVEINSHSFDGRPGSHENCPKIAALCAEYNIPIVVSSDAHYCEEIGDFTTALSVLENIGFPEELILNADSQRFLNYLHQINGGALKGE